MAIICGAIPNVQGLKVEAFEGSANVRMIVDADHHSAFASLHEFSHSLVVTELELNTVSVCLPIRRIHVMESMSTVVLLGALKPR